MNPRHTRRLMFLLLTALMLVVVIAAIVDRADAASGEPAVTISDSRITESSGLAVSSEEPDLAYTVNDSGNDPEVYAIDLTSGDVVGVTTVRADLRDTEALALRDGTLWIADVGDNRSERDDTALYAIDEPGRATRTVDARRFPVSLPGGPADVEALLAAPDSDQLVLVTKVLASAEAFAVPEEDLSADGTTLTRVGADLPALVTDGAYSPDGSRVALLSYGALWTIDPQDWSILGRQPLPDADQTETVAFVGDEAVLVGSEGEDSPLHRVVLRPEAGGVLAADTVATELPSSAPTGEPASTVTETEDGASRPLLLGGAGAAGLLALGALVGWRLRSRTGGTRAIR